MLHYLLAQIVVDPVPKAIMGIFSVPQFLLALVAGVLIAFAFQLMLTNFSVAFVMSPSGTEAVTEAEESESFGKTVNKLENTIGTWALFTVSLSLFVACFLAVKLSLVNSLFLGAIAGVVIWAIYFSLLIWFGSSAVGSLIGSLIKTATGGLSGLVGTATAAIGANAAKNQAVSTAEEIASVVRRELTSGISPDAIQETLQKSISALPVPKLDFDEIGKQFEQILKNVDLNDVADRDLLKNLDRNTVINLLSDRTNFSKQDVEQLADRFQSALKQTGQQVADTVPPDLIQRFTTGTAQELQSPQLYAELAALAGLASLNKGTTSLTQKALRYGFNTLLQTVQNRVDLSDLDVEKIGKQLQTVIQQVASSPETSEQAKSDAVQLDETIYHSQSTTVKTDIDNFVIGALPWYFNRISLPQEFRELIYDPQANPAEIRRQLEQLSPDYFAELLELRGDLNPGIISESVNIMEQVRQEVLDIVRRAEASEQVESYQSRLEDYLRSSEKAKLNDSEIEQSLQGLINDPNTDLESLQSYLSTIDANTLRSLLQERKDFAEDEVNQLVDRTNQLREQALGTIQSLRDRAQTRASEVRQQVEDYLRNTNREELNPDAIEREIRLLFDDPQAGVSALRSRLAQFDRETLVQLLSQREDLSEEQVNRILDQIESIRQSVINAPTTLARQAKQQYEQATQAIVDYLRKTNLKELNPDAIRAELSLLAYDPKAGASALGQRLSQFDRETVVKLLTQEGNLTEDQVNHAIDQVQDALRQVVRAPRRLVSRAQQRAVNFEASLENYLRNTNKEELNPDGIKRDLQLLLNDPRTGLGSLQERVSKFDRETIVALLSQREDISEEEANRIVDQVLSVRDTVVEQIQQVQQRIQSAIDRVNEQVRTYLNSLDRPELNYEGIRADFSTLFDDPQAGVDALRTRLSQFDRGTLIALLSSNPNLSEADAERIVHQIESARDGVLERAEYVQQETQRRLKQIQHQAKEQALATQKAAANAAWWLFNTALTSLVVSAIAGVLAVLTTLQYGL